MVMLDFICMGSAELLGMGREQTMQDENEYDLKRDSNPLPVLKLDLLSTWIHLLKGYICKAFAKKKQKKITYDKELSVVKSGGVILYGF